MSAKEVAVGTACTRDLYESSVVNRMLARKNGLTEKGISGIALEVLDVDQLNARDILKPGRQTKLTTNTRATQLDAVTREGGVNVRRYQYKDTPNSTATTIKQVKSGKYNQATMRGTKESAEAFNNAAERVGINKRMEASSISSKTTNRIGDKALTLKDGTINASTLATDLAGAAKSTAVGAAGITAAIEVGKSIINGDELETCANHVVSKGAEAVVSGAAAGAGGEIGFMIGGAINPLLAVPGALVGSIVSGSVAGEIVEDAFSDLGDVVENAVFDVKCGISNVFDEVGCIFSTLFI